MAISVSNVSAEVISDVRDFDRNSGSKLERLIFNHRYVVIILSALATLVLSFFALQLQVNASFDKLLPQSHPYLRNYLDNKDELKGLGNSLRVVVENTEGDIYDKEFLDAMRQINDSLFLMPGVNRPFVKSIWMSGVRWIEVTEEGFRGGAVLPSTFNGSTESIADLKTNIGRANLVGSLVANDLRSAMIVVPLLDKYA